MRIERLSLRALGSVRPGTYAPAAIAPGEARCAGGDALKRVRMTWIVGAWLASFGMLAACKQSDNETCQVNTDCDDGLVCCRGAGPRGACHAPASAACGNASVVDAGSSERDADMSMPSDADGG
jgi:hypothetical protein